MSTNVPTSASDFLRARTDGRVDLDMAKSLPARVAEAAPLDASTTY